MKKHNFFIQPNWANVIGDAAVAMGSSMANSEVKQPIVEAPVTAIYTASAVPVSAVLSKEAASIFEGTDIEKKIAAKQEAKKTGCGCSGKTCIKKKLGSVAAGILIGALVTYFIVK